MSKCDHCPSLFHTSSQCKLRPISRTPSEISKGRIEDYFAFDKVHESQMKKLVSPFSFSIDSLADKDGFYLDKEGTVAPTQYESRDLDLVDDNHEDHMQHSFTTVENQRKHSYRGFDERPNSGHFRSHPKTTNRWDNSRSASPRSGNHGENISYDRSDGTMLFSHRASRPNTSYDRSDGQRSGNQRMIIQRRDQTGHKMDSQQTATHRIDDLQRNMNHYNYENVPDAESGGAEHNNHNRQNKNSFNDLGESNRNQKDDYQRYQGAQKDHELQGSSLNLGHNFQTSFESQSHREGVESRTKAADNSVRIGASKGSTSSMRVVTSQENQNTRIHVPINSNEDSSSADFRRIASLNETAPILRSNSAQMQQIGPLVNISAAAAHENPSKPRFVNLKSSQSLESLVSNKEKSTRGSIEVIEVCSCDSVITPSKRQIATDKETATDTGDNTLCSDLKNMSYHHMKYVKKRRNAYAELDASISFEMSKMNSTISELEVLLFENAPNLVEDVSKIVNRLKTQRDCFKQVKDTYLKQLYEIEDQESGFIKRNLNPSNSNSRKRNASEADLVSEDQDLSSSKISLNSSPLAKKDRINQEYVPSIFEDTFNGFPVNAKEASATYDPSNGLVSLSSILDGKPRSALFPQAKVVDNLDGILFSTNLENKLQVWDIPTYSPIKSIPFQGDKEKTDKVSLPEDMCWVTSNSILISSKSTEKVQDQPWNNLTLLYDLKRSPKIGGFKYKILNFKEHGHGSISSIKGLPSTIENSTHWVTGGINKKIFYWRIGDLTSDTTLDSKVLVNEHTSAVTAFHYCNHKDYIYSGGLDGKVFGFNLDGVIQTSFSIKSKKIRNIQQIGSNPSNLLVTATDRECEFLIYDSLKNAPVMQFGSKKELTNADDKFERARSLYQNSAVHPNGYLVCMGDHNTSKINMWDIRRPNIPLQFDVHDKGQTDKGKSKYLSLVLGFHSLGGKQYLYSLGSDKKIVRIDLNSVF